MIHYFTNREISEKLEINLARWKRWSRSFLPPDPLGGMQSGYARQYVFKDLIKVYLGGYLISHLKLSVAESLQVINDLSPWLKRNGYLDSNGSIAKAGKVDRQAEAHHVYFCPLRTIGGKNGPGFRYYIRRTIRRQPDESAQGLCTVETCVETLINWDASDGSVLLQDPEVRMINPGALVAIVVEKLHRPTE